MGSASPTSFYPVVIPTEYPWETLGVNLDDPWEPRMSLEDPWREPIVSSDNPWKEPRVSLEDLWESLVKLKGPKGSSEDPMDESSGAQMAHEKSLK